MSPLESSLNPFYIEKPEDDKFDDDGNDSRDDTFANLPKKNSKNSDIIGPDSINFQIKNANPDDDLPTGMSYIDEEPAYVDIVIPRLAPDWKDYFMDC